MKGFKIRLKNLSVNKQLDQCRSKITMAIKNVEQNQIAGTIKMENDNLCSNYLRQAGVQSGSD